MIYYPAMTSPQSLEDRILRRIPPEILALSAVMAVPVGLVFDVLTAVFFFTGGAFSALGFLWLRESLGRFLVRDRKGALRAGLLLYILRLGLICAVFFFIIMVFPRKTLAFGAGFSSVVLVSLIEGIRALFLMKTWKD